MSHYIDDYIKDLSEFSKEICLELDTLIHKTYPTMQEGKKWGSVSYWTDEGLICDFFASKNFVTLTFYDGALLNDTKKYSLKKMATSKIEVLNLPTRKVFLLSQQHYLNILKARN